MKKVVEWLESPKMEVWFHSTWTVVWFVLIPLSAFTGLRNLIAWVVLMSAWANFVGHWSARQAAKAERDLDKKIQAIIDKVTKLENGR